MRALILPALILPALILPGLALSLSGALTGCVLVPQVRDTYMGKSAVEGLPTPPTVMPAPAYAVPPEPSMAPPVSGQAAALPPPPPPRMAPQPNNAGMAPAPAVRPDPLIAVTPLSQGLVAPTLPGQTRVGSDPLPIVPAPPPPRRLTGGDVAPAMPLAPIVPPSPVVVPAPAIVPVVATPALQRPAGAVPVATDVPTIGKPAYAVPTDANAYLVPDTYALPGTVAPIGTPGRDPYGNPLP